MRHTRDRVVKDASKPECAKKTAALKPDTCPKQNASETAKNKQGPHRFAKGQSGNPAGRPKGARHPITVLAERMLQDDAGEVVAAVVTAAKAGDMGAAKLVLERILPPRKDSPIRFDLPAVKSAGDAAAVMTSILGAVAAGSITPGEADGVAKLVEAWSKAHEANEIEKRLAALEERAR